MVNILKFFSKISKYHCCHLNKHLLMLWTLVTFTATVSILCLPKGKWFFRKMKIDSSLKEKIFPFANNCWKGFVVQNDYVFQIKFSIKICKKPLNRFFISYNCFILVFTSSVHIIFLNLLKLLHSTLLSKRFLSQIFLF